MEEERLAVIKAAQGRGEHLSRAQVNHLRQNTKERFVRFFEFFLVFFGIFLEFFYIFRYLNFIPAIYK